MKTKKQLQREINERIATLNFKIIKERQRHEKEMEKLHNELFQIRTECPHTDIEIEQDASGGHDNPYKCRFCQKERQYWDGKEKF